MGKWFFTFGMGQTLQGHCQPIYAQSYGHAREKMVEVYGGRWAFQYSEKEWEDSKTNPNRFWPMEKELEPIYCEGGITNE